MSVQGPLLGKSGSSGVLPINDETIKQLHEKHQEGEKLHKEMLLEGPEKFIHAVIFDDFNGAMVLKVAMRTKGAAGPSNFDANIIHLEQKWLMITRKHVN